MRKIIFLIVFSGCLVGANAQHPTCNGNRYKNYAFGAVDSTMNVQYGQNTTMNNVVKNLMMDIYEPTPDAAPKRPLIVFIHGGGFVGGSRKDMNGISIMFAAKGFVTATIDYRLMDVTAVDSVMIAEAVFQAVSDAKAAVRFFVEDAATGNAYRVDTNFIFICGSSAGAITAAHVAYLDPTDNIPSYFSTIISNNGGFQGNSSANTNHIGTIKGVLNYSGGLWRSDWISAGEAPMYSFHDAGDTIVPCGHALAKGTSVPAYIDGSCAMKPVADARGVYNGIYIYPGSGHGGYFGSATLDTVTVLSSNFFYDLVCTNTVGVNDVSTVSTGIQVYPNPAFDKIEITLPLSSNKKERIQIFNAMGTLCKEVEAGTSTQINIDDLPSGLYFIHTDSYSLKAEKFVKQ